MTDGLFRAGSGTLPDPLPIAPSEAPLLHLVSDGAIALALLSVAAVLVTVARRRPDMNRWGVLYLFAGVVVSGGLSHLVGAVALWHPIDAVFGALKAISAVSLLGMAVVLWRMLPRLLALPTHRQLAEANARLGSQARDLERLIAARTADLERRTREYADACTRAEAAQAAAEREARSRERFLATMSHELRTPLNAVLGFTELLALRGADAIDGKSKEYLDIVRDAAGHLLSLIDEVLDYQRIVTAGVRLAPQGLCVAEIVRTALAFNQRVVEDKALDVSIDVDDRLTVHADRRALTQVCTNLIGNAAKYCHAGSRIWVTGRTEADTVVLEVADEGFGMDGEALEAVFRPFHRAHESKATIPGTGLGLPTVKLLTEAMAGDVMLASASGRGTTATIRLPRGGRAETAEGGADGPDRTFAPLQAARPPHSATG